MNFKFYINDIEINEPIGFDATVIKLVRSENYHGVLAEYNEENFEIYASEHKEVYGILKSLYDEFGIDSEATFKVEYICSDEEPITKEYAITFYDAEFNCGNDCFIRIGIQRKGCLYQLKNGADTKVNLDAQYSIDGVTGLVPYDYLGKEIEIPSKTILLTNNAVVTDDIIYDLDESIDWNGIDETGAFGSIIIVPFDTIKFDEFGTFAPISTLTIYNGTPTTEDLKTDDATYINTETFGIKCETSLFSLKIKQKATFVIETSASYSITADPIIVIGRSIVGGEPVDVLYTSTATLVSTIGFVKTWEFDFETSFDFDLTGGLTGYNLLDIYFYFRINKTTTGFINAELTFDKDSYIDIQTLSLCESTQAKTYMVNEAISRVCEFVTNDCMRVYSDYLGRTDSQPYNFDSDGCGGMLTLTQGTFLRQLEKITPNKYIFALSFNDIMNAINAIENVGYSIENINGEDVVRVENWEYFYKNDVVIDLGSVTVRKKPNLKLHFKNYKTGYSKYEAEEFNGLDEFLTEREYTTLLKNHDGKLEKVCEFVASGYAIEITRRKGNTNSKDWRFDNDTFILCTERTGYNDMAIEQGNIINSTNIIDPPTILNYRISPARMAMNWFKYATTFIKGIKQLIFSSGKGNIIAQGELLNDCKIDKGVISENQNILEADFIENIIYDLVAEIDVITDCPFSFQQNKALELNPHGLIRYECDGVEHYGWLNRVSYSMTKGTADFEIISKI